MKELTSALETLQRATDIDEEHKHGNEIRQLENKCQQALFTQRSGESQEETLARAMKDPEVAVRAFFLSCEVVFPVLMDVNGTEHHERPGHAADSAAGAAGSGCAARAYEEPDDQAEDPEVDQRWCYQDEISYVSLEIRRTVFGLRLFAVAFYCTFFYWLMIRPNCKARFWCNFQPFSWIQAIGPYNQTFPLNS
ncbi:hypothetical protein BDV98DRAFT_107779 [Pterulicium gracile]|uniref:Uncharacterized protein n=1 Tax=Pterulicium gracile TaxID=1884261 RepID=A0A5C3QQM1_9AGAR|nr:hypothetical protein BDV98DRAFT_107779 [Pterula gracilis]